MSSAATAAPPHPSSTLVNVAEHAELRLVRLLSEPTSVSPNFEQQCEACIANADASGLIRTVVSDPGALSNLLTIDPVDEAVSAFSLLAALLDRVESNDDESSLVSEMATAVVNASAHVGSKRVAMLCALYNLRSDPIEKATLLSKIVSLASSADPGSLTDGQPLGDALAVEKVVSTLDGGRVPPKERRALYRAIADGGQDDRRQRYLLLLVETYSDPSEVDGDALDAAKNAAIGAVRDPVTLFAEQRGMLTWPAVQALGTNPATKTLHSLLEIFQEGKLQEYETFASQNSSALQEYDLDGDDCVRHMRLLSLCSLAAEHEEIPYDDIASTLRVGDGEVESWVISAVSSGLLSAKMDQLQRVVMVERCVVRRFGPEQWKSLQARLDAWKRNVRGVLEGLKQSQAVQQQQQQQQQQQPTQQ